MHTVASGQCFDAEAPSSSDAGVDVDGGAFLVVGAVGGAFGAVGGAELDEAPWPLALAARFLFKPLLMADCRIASRVRT
jgi:hypothetical protein